MMLRAVLVSAVVLTGVVVMAMQGGPWERRAEDIPRTLDSLAALSVGSYVHLEVYGCPGQRCETRVSVWQEESGEPYRYRGYAWMGLPAKPQWRGFNAELRPEEAGTILAGARLGGVMRLVADSSKVDRWTPRFWLRARFGDATLSIDGASLASGVYKDTTEAGLARVYEAVVAALVEPIRARHGR